jgi:hypothetical protein
MRAPKVKNNSMVKIKLSISRKRYLRGKRVYRHMRGHFPIPSKILQKLEPYLKEDFKPEINDSEVGVSLTYTYYKKAKQPQTG